MPTTPPFSATARSNVSGLLRGCGWIAAQPAWVISTGGFDAARTSAELAALAWLMSIATPCAFIAATALWPSSVRPAGGSAITPDANGEVLL